MPKRVVAVIVVLLALAGCGGPGATAGPGTTTGAAGGRVPVAPEAGPPWTPGSGPPALDFVPDLRGGPGPSPCGGDVLCVAVSGGTHTSVQDAVDDAPDGAVVQVEEGTYQDAGVVVVGRSITLLGGFVAGSGFAERDPVGHPTVLDGDGRDSVVVFEDDALAATFTIDGFVVTGGVAAPDEFGGSEGSGIRARGGAEVVISHNLIEANGLRDEWTGEREEGSGGGIAVGGAASATITANVVRGNHGALAGGIQVGGDGVRIEGNLVEGNVGHSDHGGGMFLAGDGMVVRGNLVRGNEVGATAGYGWGGGAIYAGRSDGVLPLPTAVFEENRWVGNSAPSYGSGLFVDEGGHADIRGDLFHDNACAPDGAAAIAFDGGSGGGSTGTVENVTVVGHGCPDDQRGTALNVHGSSSVAVRNSIFTGNGGDSEVLFCDGPDAEPCTIGASGVADSSGTIAFSIVGGPIVGGEQGDGLLDDAPGFVDPDADDYRPAAGSPAVGAGDPALPADRSTLGAYPG